MMQTITERSGPSPAAYRRANQFLQTLKRHDGEITRQEYKTLRGQAINGDVDGAYNGLDTILYGRNGRTPR